MGRSLTSRHLRTAHVKRDARPSPSRTAEDNGFDAWDEDLWDEFTGTERELRFGDHAERPTAEELSILTDALPIRSHYPEG